MSEQQTSVTNEGQDALQNEASESAATAASTQVPDAVSAPVPGVEESPSVTEQTSDEGTPETAEPGVAEDSVAEDADPENAEPEAAEPELTAAEPKATHTEPQIAQPAHADLSHLDPAALAEAIAVTEEINEADEVYAAELALLESAPDTEPHRTPHPSPPEPAHPATPTPHEPRQSGAPNPVPRPKTPAGSPGRPAPGAQTGRRPSPNPIPHPPAHQPGHPPPMVTEPLVEPSDPTPWGWVAEDGTVFVRTSAGERAVGSWQAGDPAAGLAHYGRRYDDFITEIVILEKRLANRSGEAKATRTHAQMLRESIETLPAVGDLDSAAARLETVIGAAEQAISHAAQDRATAKAAAVATREALCAEAEALAESNQWKTAGDRLKTILEEWRTIRGIDRKTDDLLWKRFAKARDTFTRRRGSHFAELDKERGAAKDAKEKLIARAEELAESTDFAETAAEYRSLMTEWKASGRAPREVEDALWERFRDAQEKFFSRRQKTFADRDAEFEANAALKETLLLEAEKIDPGRGLDAAKAALRSIQDRWEAAGKVPRERIRTLDARLRAVEDKVKSVEDSLWRKSDPETTARLAQFRSRYDAYQVQADKARAAGDTKRAAAAQAQANQWHEWLKAAENAVD